ncbi:hypothetical protein M0R04_11455 [Candidatus Dojkabacteria bacterium]|jgi:hypothetical protein|nr:hypothetical protein [Candidatus Dojkabacteria bacterium]
MTESKQILLTPDDQKYIEMMEDLNKPRGKGLTAGLTTRLHDGQIEVLSHLYNKNKNFIMMPCGRKFGKSEVATYALWKRAMFYPGSACYYVVPEGNHGRQFIWDNHRLQNFLEEDSKKYIKSAKNVEMLLTFKNGSYIKVLGSENFGVANGLDPHFAVYDEFKLFHPRWHTDFAPNLTANAAPLIIIGTLPTPGDSNSDQYYEVLKSAKNSKNSAVLFKTTFDNPIMCVSPQKEAVEEQIQQLMDRGEEDVVQREYYSKIIPGGKRSIFPMFSVAKHVIPHQDILEHIKKDYSRLEPILSVDPGSSTVFGGLFCLLNRYSGCFYIVDELYQKTQAETSCSVVLPLIRSKCTLITPRLSLEEDWLKVSDDAAVWFMNEAINDLKPLHFFPAQKFKGTRDEGFSLIKDMLIHGKLIISDKCINLINEIIGYAVDSQGKISNKIPDHNIDSLRYALIASNYTFELLVDTMKFVEEIERGRYRRVEDEIDEESFDINAGIAWNDGFDLSF